MAWVSSGGYPGVVSDGFSGLNVTGAVLAGSLAAQPGGTLIIYAPDGGALLQVAPNTSNAGISAKHGLGLFGAVPPSAATAGGAHTAGGTYTATEEAMLNAVYTALRSIGLIT